ncbi:hypothetical protein [Gordonia soli]|uniref:Uncharacterized protein n=1 Tax=Gordonia soli NBRC 108243 TaxID=1223545 RepID=M0QG04_9ACTN|nr:hypothetical protein [Gordonia soli]GAC67508.1 hypothetical protein GS4_08_00930 [Gordonia soli NBRC 108243]
MATKSVRDVQVGDRIVHDGGLFSVAGSHAGDSDGWQLDVESDTGARTTLAFEGDATVQTEDNIAI